jgi:CTP:molybdopterin cytidylyltransferase MocA
VIFPRAAFPDLEALDSDKGAKALFDDERFTLTVIDADDQALDVDTRADLDAFSGS